MNEDNITIDTVATSSEFSPIVALSKINDSGVSVRTLDGAYAIKIGGASRGAKPLNYFEPDKKDKRFKRRYQSMVWVTEKDTLAFFRKQRKSPSNWTLV